MLSALEQCVREVTVLPRALLTLRLRWPGYTGRSNPASTWTTGFGLRDLDRMGVLDKEKTAVRDSYASRVGYARRTILARLEAASWCCTSRSFSRIFDLFYERYLKAVEAAKQQGAFDQQAGFAGSAWRRFAPLTCGESPKRKRCSWARHPASAEVPADDA